MTILLAFKTLKLGFGNDRNKMWIKDYDMIYKHQR